MHYRTMILQVWEMVSLSAFLVGREVGTRMAERGSGTLIFTGATASVRGGAGFSAFSGAMFSKRSLAQSLARELGPRNVHVAHVVIDGAISTPWVSRTLNVGGLLRAPLLCGCPRLLLWRLSLDCGIRFTAPFQTWREKR